jgi:hypothetical protein
MANNDGNIILEGVVILPGRYRNFSGKPTPYKKDGGDRDFAVLLPDDLAEQMHRDGLIVKHTKDREDDEGELLPGSPFIKVKVNFDGIRPPQIFMSTSRNRTHLSEGEVDILDTADIVKADMIIRPWETVVNGVTHHPLYLQSLYVDIEEDYLAEKYARMDEDRKRRD